MINRKLSAVVLALVVGMLLVASPAAASASTGQLEAGKVTGAPALIIILVILALIIIGVISVIRFIARKTR